MSFQVGDRIVGIAGSPYRITEEGWIGIVTQIYPTNRVINVRGVGHSGEVNPRWFVPLENAESKADKVNRIKEVTSMRDTQVILNAVEGLRTSEYKATAIKVELEADIDRHSDCENMTQDILERLEPHGLSEQTSGFWKPKKPLVYADVYNDHSVDTELTFTLLLDKPTNILLLPKVIDVFKEVAEDSGEYFSTSNAGMHIALLNNAAGKYPARVKAGDKTRFKNFRKSMIRLLPALYFLGSHDETSRDLRFRKPQITDGAVPSGGRYDDDNQKYSAVAFREGSVEFRIFETCYDNPDVILDMVVVMSNAMKFWTTEHTRNHLPKVAEKIRFGIQSGHRLDRMFFMEEHIDLLNAGLNILKPSYYTVKELKKQRNFTITKKALNTKMKEVRLTAVKNYKEYEKRFAWERVYIEQDYMRRIMSGYTTGGYETVPEDMDKALEIIRRKAKETVEHELPIQKKKSATQYIQEAIDKAIPSKGGQWELSEGDDEVPVIPPVELRSPTIAFGTFFEEAF